MLQITLLTSVLSIAIAQTGPHLKIFDLPNSGGDSRIVQHPTSSLASIGFQHRMSSYCISNGAFIIYTDDAFSNLRLNSGSFWTWSTDMNCYNVERHFDNRASSVRPVGDPNDFRRSSITLYEQEGFGGRAEIYFTNTHSVGLYRNAKSIIVTGVDPWTLYDVDGYRGVDTCIYPGLNYKPGFYPKRADLGAFADRVVSLAKGCRFPRPTFLSFLGKM